MQFKFFCYDNERFPGPSPVRPGPDSVGRSWLRLLGAIAALLVLACALPTPLMVAGALSGRQTALAAATGATAVGESAMLLLAAIAVWTLLLWALAVAAAATLGRVPGSAGRIGRRILGRIAPAMAKKLLLTVMGASMLSGTAACGTPAGSTPSAQGELLSSGAALGIGDIAGAPHFAAVRHPHAAVAGSVDRPAAVSARSWIAVEGSVVHLRTGAAHFDPRVVPPDHRQRQIDPPGTAGPLPRASVGPEWPDSAPIGQHRPTDNPVDVDWPSTPPTSAEPLVVLRGDSLWGIAARHLPGAASSSQIDRAWHRWYAANATVIGPNPDLILPGQILLPPDPEMGDSP